MPFVRTRSVYMLASWARLEPYFVGGRSGYVVLLILEGAAVGVVGVVSSRRPALPDEVLVWPFSPRAP